METKILQSINLIRRGSGVNRYLFRYAAKSCDGQGVVTVSSYGASDGGRRQNRIWNYAAMLLCLLTIGVGNAWGGSAYMSAKSADPAQGLVYSSTSSSAPSTDKYQEYYPGGCVVGTTGTDASPANKCYYSAGSSTGPHTTYAWAKPARGYKFKEWTGYMEKTSDSKKNINTASDRSSWNGDADVVKNSAGGRQCTYTRIVASFEPATSYTITYAKPVGGSYTVGYSYLKTRERSTAKFYNASGTANSYKDYEFYTDNSESYSLSPSSDGNQAVTSYADDAITMTASGANFVGWYEGSTQKSTSASYTAYKANANVTITALFKTMSLGTAEGDLSPAVEVLGAMSPNPTITVPVTAHGSWSASDFTVTFTENGSRGDITKGTVAYAQNSGNVLSSVGTLTIPFAYNPSSWGNTEVNVTVSPKDGSTYGNSIEFTIKASATQVLDYEACILLENETEPQSSNTGTLAEMVTLANSMDSKFTLQLAKDVTISSPLSLRKSMKFDLNDKKITSTGTSAFSIDAAGVDVQIVDEGFGGLGEVATESAQSGNVSVVTFTQKAKLTMQGGTLSAKNTGSGSAYGINVTQGSTFYMTNGQLTVTGVSEAHGVHVATASDYATLNGGTIAVTAPTKAYGVWSAGQSNVTGATIGAETTTGANAYGVYVNGGVSTLTNNTVSATANTTGAYAAYVNAGRLNGNGGSFAAEAVTSGVYGVHVQAGATAVVQQNAVVTAEATGASGTSVFGVNNLGTVSLTNVSVTATSPTTNATAVNTATSATSTTIEGGTYRANTTSGTAYGLHHQYGTLNVDGGEFKAVGSGNSIYGARATVDATIANASIWGETQGSGNTAYGFVGATAGKNITLTNCTITGLSVTSKAYAIYSRANVTATGCTLTATTTGTNEAYGLYAENGTNKLVNTDATVTANTIQAYGINHLDGSLTIEGGRFEVTAEQKTAGADEESKLYGIYNAANKTSTVANAEFVVRATNASYAKYMYGAYTLGTLNSTNTIYDVKGKVYARGIYNSGTLNLQNNTITAENTNGSDCYGIYATNKFTINGDEVFAKSNLKTVYAMTFGASAEGDVLAGKFYATGNGTNDFGAITKTGTIGKVRLKGGVYKTVSNLQRYAYTGLSVFNIDDIHPDYAAGYRYTIAAEAPSPYVCYIKNGNKYETLAAALQYTKDNSGNFIIIMSQNHTLQAGDYELPSNATLIVPYKTGQETLATAPVKRNTAGLIEEHIRLTLASGANLNVSGKIEVGGELYCVESGLISYNNSPYAHIRMEEGSLIQLNSGARLYAWGFITGAGNITVKNGAEVHEMFQIGDMPAMSPLVQYYNNNNHKFFPLNQYFIQNIEDQTTYYYGSKLICSFSNYYTGSFNGDDNIKLVGTESSLFLITSTDESSWVRKSYDAAHDYQVWEVNSDVQLGSLSLSISGYTFNSTKYILPVTSNMKIHVLDGDFAITQSTQFLPGTQIEVNKTASLKVNSGQKVYMFDKDQWPFSAKTIAFSPSWPNGNKPSRSGLFVDAALNVHGKINVEGSLYTSNKGTTTKTDGANIYSTNADAGTISYNVASPSSTTITLMTSSTATTSVSMESAKLKNGDGTYAQTASTASGEAWIYMNDQWQKTYTNGCFEVIGSTVYAKPSEYVALKKSQTVGGKLTGVAEDDHTYLTADDKILILMDDCQWWEVEATSDPAVFECKKEGYKGFYYYNTSTNKWELKTVDVKFYKNETGETVLKTITTSYKGIPDQAVIATNPTKETTAAATYAFYGWKSSVTGTEYKWTDPLEVATADMSYRPVFTETPRNYTITLVNANNGASVPLEVAYGSVPEYTAVKEADAQYTYSFEGWSPAFTTVTGTATYTANWNSVVNEYNITWMNGETVLEVDENQPYGTVTSYGGATPTKAADDDYAYTFSGWHNSLTNAPKANNETVTGEITYTAQYNTTPRYAVTFNNYDGTQLDRIVYTQGEVPAYGGVPTRKRDSDGYFKFIGWKNSNGTDYAANATLPAVTKKETYTAQYEYVTDLFTITLKNVHGNGESDEWSGKFGVGSIPFYNPNDDDVPVTPTKAGNVQYTYVFSSWSPAMIPVNGEATYTAVFSPVENKYAVSVAAGANGSVSPASVSEIGYETASADITATPDAGYAFNGWTLPEGVTAADGYTVASNPIRIHAIAADKTITANFVARTDINYTVKHYQQNIVDDDYTEVTADQETLQGTTATSTEAVAKEYTGFTALPFEQSTIVGDGSTVVNIYYNRNTYTIAWVDGDGNTIKTDDAVKYGAVPSYESETPAKSNTETQTFVFAGWDPEIAEVTDDAIYTAKFNAHDLDLHVTEQEQTINEDVTITTTTVTTTGDLEVTEGNTLTTNDLVLEASLVDDEEGSGEIRGAGTVNPTGNVYFDLKLNTWPRHWRAFGVPWKIANLKTTKLVEIKTKNGAPCHNELVLGRDYDIVYYNGAKRAQQGPGRHCWDYVEDGDGTLDPGKAYLIGFIRPTGTVRFTKAEGAPIRRSNETLEVPYYEGNGVGTDAGWNAIANPKTYHATMNAEVEWCHVHNGDTMRSDGFTTKQMSEVKFVVGTAVFVQANPDKSVVYITRQHHSPSAPAPRRVAAHEDAPQYHAIHIMANNKSADRIYIKADEDKETDTYTNGIDVAKMGISTVRAQIWVERYNTQLAVNTMAPVNNTVSYPLGISVPQAGEYEIQLSDESSNMIYLTYDNRIIWNLSYSPYVANLEKGANTHYGIRMVVSKTPAITTDVEKAQDGTQQAVQKIIIEDKVYILRGEKLYTITGQLVQ